MNEAPIVLVVDDDADVLELAAGVLARCGYSVVTAENAQGALDVLRGGQPVDLLFTDIVMPGKIDGFELAQRARKLRPGLKVIYTSGFLKTVPLGQTAMNDGPFIQKPWRAEALAEQFRRTLGR